MWMELLSETTSRDGFSQNAREYYISFLQTLRDMKAGGLMFAGYNGRIIAAGIYIYYHNTAIYYYGASTSDPELRKHMAPYLLQWEAIREGKLRGCTTYDLLGVAPPGEIDHPLA
jgi:lipid II:glycine glycyltransferase (peptidoglycan interpeptide bridge formation enzyme)